MSSPTHSNELVVGLGFVLLVGVVLLIFHFVTTNTGPNAYNVNNANNVIPQTNQVPAGVSGTPVSGSSPTTATAPVQTTVKTPIKKTGPSASAPKKYVVDVAKYKASGYYIQIYPGCQATPGSLTVKKGSSVMFDNRNGQGHTISYKSVNHWLGAYGYAVLTFDYTGANYVTCDGGGSAKVTVMP